MTGPVATLSAEQLTAALGRLRSASTPPPTRSAPAARTRPPEPWSSADVRAAGPLAGVGLLALALCWLQVSGLTDQRPQLTTVVLGVCAGVLTAGAGVVWMLAGLRAVRRRAGTARTEALAAVTALTNALPDWQRALPAPGIAVAAEVGPVSVTGMTRVHRPGCLMVRGKDTTPAVPGSGAACGVCRP